MQIIKFLIVLNIDENVIYHEKHFWRGSIIY